LPVPPIKIVSLPIEWYRTRLNLPVSIMSNNRAGYITVFIAMLCWSLTFVWYKEVYEVFTPIGTVFLRLLIASVLLLIFTLSIRRLQRIEKSDRLTFLALAFFEPFIYFFSESYGMKYVSPTEGAVIIAVIPLLTPFMAKIFFGDRITALNLLGLVISFAGVVLVVTNTAFHWKAPVIGVAFMFMAVMAALGYSAIIMKLSGKYNPFTIITYQNSIAGLLFLPLFLIFDLDNFMAIEFTFQNTWPLLKLAVVASAVAYLFFVYSISKIGIVQANMFTNLIPVFAAIFAWYMLDDELTWRTINGVGLVVVGLFLPHYGTVRKRYFFLKK
jgi:drug/metabolite transporter (DMT)-like permease